MNCSAGLSHGRGAIENLSPFAKDTVPAPLFTSLPNGSFEMARPRTPTNVLDARGSFRKHPERKRTDPATSGPLTEPPSHLSEQALACWKEIAGAAPLEVLTNSDRIALEMAAMLLAQFRADPVEFPAMKLTRLEVLLGKFGMTPADRARVSTGKAKKPSSNPFADL